MPKIASVFYSWYPQDTRTRREAEALMEAGMSVDVFCISFPDQPPRETIGSIRVHRFPMVKDRGGKLSYILQYFGFLLRAFLTLTIEHMRNRYDVIHVHNMPDFLVFAALVPKLCGSKVVLDLHDPMPEMYMTKYSMGADSPVIRILKLLEKWSIRFADIVLTPNITFRNLFIERGCPEDKIHIIMNSPMEKVFHSGAEGSTSKKDPDRFVMMFHGGIYERHGLDTALKALASLRHELPNIEFNVYGDGDYKAQFLKLVDEYALNDVVKYHGMVSLETISQKIRSIDVGIIPNKKSPFTDLNLPVRIFEYLCLKKPVIVPKTRGILDYFDEDSLFFFEPGNVESLAGVIRRMYHEPKRQQKVTERGVKVYMKYRWELQRQYLVELFNGLM